MSRSDVTPTFAGRPPARRAFLPLALAAGVALAADGAVAQLIPLRTVPVAAGDQFLVVPAANLGMGGVSLALEDPLLDPFVSPARGASVRESTFFTSPIFYGISNDNGSGRTLPVGGLFAGRGGWFGGASVALQQIRGATRPTAFPWWWGGWTTGSPLSERSSTNLYASGYLGRTLPGTGVSVGVSASYADLDAMDGVDLLYAMSERIEQWGHRVDLRVGVLAELQGGREAEAVVVFNRLDMTHDVTYTRFLAGPVTDEPFIPPQPQRVVEKNLDRTRTAGLHLGYRVPLEGDWTLGLAMTGNRKWHPKIPNYEIMNIPRDPGDSWASAFGLGVARSRSPTTVGVDVVFEPAWSDTWAEAEDTIAGPNGRRVLPGEKTVENDFRFSNALVRTGVARELGPATLQLGLQVRAISYDLDQLDNVTGVRRDQRESWMEWTPTWGASLGFTDLTVRYQGRLTTGAGRPGVAWAGTPGRLALEVASVDFLVAPSGPLTLEDARVLTHQVTISLPLR